MWFSSSLVFGENFISWSHRNALCYGVKGEHGRLNGEKRRFASRVVIMSEKIEDSYDGKLIGNHIRAFD